MQLLGQQLARRLVCAKHPRERRQASDALGGIGVHRVAGLRVERQEAKAHLARRAHVARLECKLRHEQLHQRKLPELKRQIAHELCEDHLAHLSLCSSPPRLLGIPRALLRLTQLHGALHTPLWLHVGHALP